MTSTLVINNLQIGMLGAYRVIASNGIRSTKQFTYLVLPEGALFLCHILPEFRQKLRIYFRKFYNTTNVKNMHQDCHFVNILVGPPTPPVISKTLTRVTAVSVNLVWTSGYNGGYPQTFSVIYQHLRSSTGTIIGPVNDPGYGEEVSLFIGDLRETSPYKFTVRTENSYDGLSTSYSETELFETTGEYKIVHFSLVFVMLMKIWQ